MELFLKKVLLLGRVYTQRNLRPFDWALDENNNL